MSGRFGGFNEASSIHGFFAYRAPEDVVALGFMVRMAMPVNDDELDAEAAESAVDSILGMIDCWAQRTGQTHLIDDIDFDLCGEARVRLNVTYEVRQRIGNGQAFLMLRDAADFSGTIENLLASNDTGVSPVIDLDVVADLSGDLSLITSFDELTGAIE